MKKDSDANYACIFKELSWICVVVYILPINELPMLLGHRR